MSYSNYLDADAAWNCASEFKNPTCVIVKRTNPCGVASRTDILEACRLAMKADPVSAFDGIVAFNVEVDEVISFYLLFLLLTILIAHNKPYSPFRSCQNYGVDNLFCIYI